MEFHVDLHKSMRADQTAGWIVSACSVIFLTTWPHDQSSAARHPDHTIEQGAKLQAPISVTLNQLTWPIYMPLHLQIKQLPNTVTLYQGCTEREFGRWRARLKRVKLRI